MPSGRYEESLKPERTQIDLINEMAQELISLPRFAAYAKVIQERGGQQGTVRGKIKTLPVPPSEGCGVFYQNGKRMTMVASESLVKQHAQKICKQRREIEQEIRQRQEKWRGQRLFKGESVRIEPGLPTGKSRTSWGKPGKPPPTQS